MFEKLSDKLTNSLISNNTITADDREIYHYGIQQGIILILNTATTLFIGIISGMIWQSIVFMFAYIPLRSYTGGFHAKTPVRCYFSSIGLMTVVLLVMRYIHFSMLIYGILMFISGTVILLLAPMENHNKPLDEIERKVYKKRAYGLWICECLFVVTAMLLSWKQLAVCFIWAIIVAALMLVLGKLENTSYMVSNYEK